TGDLSRLRYYDNSALAIIVEITAASPNTPNDGTEQRLAQRRPDLGQLSFFLVGFPLAKTGPVVRRRKHRHVLRLPDGAFQALGELGRSLAGPRTVTGPRREPHCFLPELL